MTPYAICPKEVFHDRTISANAKALCGLISTYETAENKRWITLKQGEMAEILSVTRETVNRLVKQLVARGHLETRPLTSSARGRISLQYRVRHDLPEQADAVIQALKAEGKKPAKSADVTPSSHEEADVTPDAQPPEASVIPKSQRPADVSTKSHHNGADVISTSLPCIELNTLTSENYINHRGGELFPAAPKTAARRKPKTEPDRSKPHPMPSDWMPSEDTRVYARSLTFEEWEIDAAAIECREFWCERPNQKRAGWDNTFKRRLRDLKDDPKQRAKLKLIRPKANGADDREWRRRLANFEHDGSWSSTYGPRPGQPGYQGPPIAQEMAA